MESGTSGADALTMDGLSVPMSSCRELWIEESLRIFSTTHLVVLLMLPWFQMLLNI